MNNAGTRFGVYTAEGLYLAGIRSDDSSKPIHVTSDKGGAAKMARGAAVRVLHYLRGAGLSCWLVPL